MGNQLLIRAYNVGCGDCIYVRIPNNKDGFHILIDCGKKGDAKLLGEAVKHMEENLLPPGSAKGKKRIDLIVATHRHEDHIKGFDPKSFANIEVKNVWLSVAMNPKHPQAAKTRKLHNEAGKQMRALLANGHALSPQAEMLATMYVSNDQADDLLMKEIPSANKIDPKYVQAGMVGSKLGLKLPPKTEIRILAPEEDIDGYYLGKEADASLRGMQAIGGSFREQTKNVNLAPTNISAADFRTLQSRMLSNGLAFAAKDSSIQNNLSVVMLIEWGKRRLLFVGDAEWDAKFADGRQNASWNVMWEKRKKLLNAPVDFLKIGHHGSVNATPPGVPERGLGAKQDGRVYEILDAILPVPKKGKKPTAQAIVSTEREFYDPIPSCERLIDVARRVSNTRNYAASFAKAKKDPAGIWVSTKAKKNKFFEKYERPNLDKPQPLRTDLEFHLNEAEFVDVEVKP